MGKVLLDSEMRSKLNGLDEQTEICDEAGKPLGLYIPLTVYKKLVDASVAMPFTEEEIARFRSEADGRPLAEIWKSLGRP